MYIYKTTIYRNTDNVIGLDVTQNNIDKTNFELNKSQSTKVTEVVYAEMAFIIEKTYVQFSALITGDITWSDVKYIEKENKYELILISGVLL